MKTNFTQQLIQHCLDILLGNVQWQAVRALFCWCSPHYGLLILNTKQNVFYNNSDRHPLYPVDSSLLDFKLLSYSLCKVGETNNFLEKDLTETSGQASLQLGHLWRWCEVKTWGVTSTCECLGVAEMVKLLRSLLPHRTQEEWHSQGLFPPQARFLWAHTLPRHLTLGRASSALGNGGVNLITAFLMGPAWDVSGSQWERDQSKLAVSSLWLESINERFQAVLEDLAARKSPEQQLE